MTLARKQLTIRHLDFRTPSYEPEGRGFPATAGPGAPLLEWFHVKFLRCPFDLLCFTTSLCLDYSAAGPSKNEQGQATNPATEGE